MSRRLTLSEMVWPDDPEDSQLPVEWAESVAVQVLDWVWRGFDAVRAKYLNSADLTSQTPEQLERNLTEFHFLEISLLWARENGGFSSVQPCHESPELASRRSAFAKPPAYDFGFVHIENRRWKWPIEAKVLSTASAVSDYLKDVREKFIAGIAAPFVGEAGMIGYLLKGLPDEVFDKVLQGSKIMKTLSHLTLTMLATALIQSSSAKELSEMKVLYVGSGRAAAYVDFLKSKVAKIETRPRAGFKVTDADPFDVVLLDWQQTGNGNDFPPKTSPLGARGNWTKPTVLLGSAGLNLAVVWQMKGGIGCTCMDPLAYGLREHEIFERPFKIDRSKMISIPTPQDFRAEIKEPEIKVLALVNDHKRSWSPGWCTYSYDFASNPDVEYFCGGVNHKTPTAAGLWRQGNFLHFGFEQSPAEMNEQGRSLLLNSIAYISRFTEDRPIAITASVFAGTVSPGRNTPARRLRNPEYKMEWIKETVTPELWEKLLPLGREKMAEWFDQKKAFLHPNSKHQLELDEDLVALGVSFDTPEFFDKTLGDLRAGGDAANRARRLLDRYVPTGPKSGSVDQWDAWWRENKPYAFASDSGDYCWYIDPLAKKRGVPTDKLRGPMRADAMK